MAFYKVTKKQSGGGGTTILKGSTAPTSSQGSDGQLYLRYGAANTALLHFENSAIEDVFGNTWVAEGNATISDTQAKFGTKSLYLDASSYIRSNVGDSIFNFGTNHFTISCWIYPTFSGRKALFAMSADCRIGCDLFFQQGSANMWLGSNGNWNAIQSDRGGSDSGIGTIAINTNEWTHIAYIRKGNTCKMFVNGQLAKATDIAEGTSVYWTGNDSFQIGKWGGVMDMFTGYIDEFVMVNGSALWDDVFTPPTQPFDVSDFDNVVLEAYAKVDGAWQTLVGTDIDDIIT